MNVRSIRGFSAGIVVLAVIAGGEAQPIDRCGDGALYWCGGESGPGPGYAAVRMHNPFRGRLVDKTRDRDGMAGMGDTFSVGKGLSEPAVFVPPTPLGHRSVVLQDERVSDDSLFGEIPASKDSDTRSGWGWLADEVLQKRDAARDLPRGNATQPADGTFVDPLRRVGTDRVSDDPYAELYNMWQD